jgi:hypothetical protein
LYVYWRYVTSPQWQKDSAIDGVRNLIENPSVTAEDSHKNWMDHKLQNGWIYGEKKSEKFKTHPCIVRYELLPLEQQIKDHIFRSLVLGFFSSIDVKRSEDKHE